MQHMMFTFETLDGMDKNNTSCVDVYVHFLFFVTKISSLLVCPVNLKFSAYPALFVFTELQRPHCSLIQCELLI